MADAGTLGQQMPRQEDDLPRRVKELEKQMQQVTSAAAGAQAVAGSLTALLSNQVNAAVGSGSGTATWGTSYSTFASFSFTVPAGYTRAAVFATGGAACFSTTTGDIFRMRVVINGSASPESGAGVSGANLPYISAAQTSFITGLSDGSSISVSLQGHLSNGPGNSSVANIVGMAIYLK